jgi:hypothetical protein
MTHVIPKTYQAFPLHDYGQRAGAAREPDWF